MEVNKFNNDHFSYLSENLFGEKSKNAILMGDFKVDFLKYKNDSNTADFLDLVYSYSLVPKITTPTCFSPRSKTLIDNVFTISGYTLTTISDHLAQFIMYLIDQLKRDNKMDIYEWSFKNFKPQDFQRDLENINWDRALKINKNQTIQSFERFFNVLETLLDASAPLKKLTNKEVKLHLKPWLTNGIMTSIRQKDKLYKNFQELMIGRWNKNRTKNLKNHTHVKKVGHTSQFLFGIYWWTWKTENPEI